MPFQRWALASALARLRRKLGTEDKADRRFVRVLAAVLTDGFAPHLLAGSHPRRLCLH